MDKVKALAKHIKLLILDIDGICTDGKLHFNEKGEAFKSFHVHDGLGISLLQKSGIDVAVISARKSEAVNRRMQALGVKHIYQGNENKALAYKKLLSELNLTDEDVAYAGDDLPDLPLICRAKLGISVPNAIAFVKEHADWITEKSGGQGAVREICEMILQAREKLDLIRANYLKTD